MFIEVTTHAEQKPKINTNNINAIINNQLHFAGGLVLELTDESMEELLDKLFPTKTKKTEKKLDKEMFDLFIELHKLTGGKGKPIFNAKREKKLKDLLGKHRMTKEQLKKAAKNIGEDDFLQGQDGENTKRYGDIDYLLRPDKAAKWAEAVPKKKKGMF